MDRPNVIVIMVDQMKANASHLWGSRFNHTPGLERLAARGAVCHSAYAVQPLCVPARIAFWSALAPHTSGCRTNQSAMPADTWHAFRTWKAQGFTTGLIGKDHCFHTADHDDLFDVRCEISHFGFEREPSARGMDWCVDPALVEAAHATRRRMHDTAEIEDGVTVLGAANYAVTDYDESAYSTGLVTGQTVKFLEERGTEPFALWVSYPDPHTPYEAPRRLFETARERVKLSPWRADEFDGAPERLKVLHRMMSLEGVDVDELRNLVACYHAMVDFIDEGVNTILDTLDRCGLGDNTIVVFTSDHGDFAGEHMMMAKGGAFFDCLAKVPLIVASPGHTPRRIDIHEPVSSLDVVPTLFALQGLDVPADVDGRGLPAITSDPPRDVVFSEYGAGAPLFTLDDLSRQSARTGRPAVAESLRRREWEGNRMMAFDGRWKYVHDPSGDLDELYDLEDDPDELFNLAADERHRNTMDRLKRELRQWSPDAFRVPA